MRKLNEIKSGRKAKTFKEKLISMYSAEKAEKNGMITATEYKELLEHYDELKKEILNLKEESWYQNRKIENQEKEKNLLLVIIENLINEKLKRKNMINNPFFDFDFLGRIFLGI